MKKIKIAETPKNRPNYFGETLREFRLQKKLTQGVVAQELGIRQSQLSSYEKGLLKPNFDIVLTIADKFGISPLVFVAKSYDKYTNVDPVEELSFTEYETCLNENFIPVRNTKIKEKISSHMERLSERLTELAV